MGKILLISQSEKETWFSDGVSVGKRNPKNIWGDKIKEVLKEKNITEEEFINEFGNSYKENIERVLRNEEIPKKQVLDKILKITGKENGFFLDKQLENIIVNDKLYVVAEYETNARALEVKKELDERIINCYASNQPIIIRIPKE